MGGAVHSTSAPKSRSPNRAALKSPLAQKHFERGRQYELQSRDEEAIDAYRRACHMEPGFPDPYVALGRLEAIHGRPDRALAALDKGLAFGPDKEALEWRGYVRGRLRRYDEAYADYRTLMEIGGDGEGVRLNAARMLLAMGRYDEAEPLLLACAEGQVLHEALPRYREFPCASAPGQRIDGDPNDDQRAVRYLFGGTLVLGTLGDGGQPLAYSRYMLLTERHIAISVGRLLKLIRVQGWRFDMVAGSGPHHGPLASALGRLLEVPHEARPVPGARVLLVSAVLNGHEESRAIEAPWRDRGCRVLHFAQGLVPKGDPSPHEPAVVGFVSRCAVPWFRTAPYARLVADTESQDPPTDGPWPGFKVGPAFVDPNAPRVTEGLVEACLEYARDPFVSTVLDYYIKRHPQVRAFSWAEEDT